MIISTYREKKVQKTILLLGIIISTINTNAQINSIVDSCQSDEQIRKLRVILRNFEMPQTGLPTIKGYTTEVDYNIEQKSCMVKLYKNMDQVKYYLLAEHKNENALIIENSKKEFFATTWSFKDDKSLKVHPEIGSYSSQKLKRTNANTLRDLILFFERK